MQCTMQGLDRPVRARLVGMRVPDIWATLNPTPEYCLQRPRVSLTASHHSYCSGANDRPNKWSGVSSPAPDHLWGLSFLPAQQLWWRCCAEATAITWVICSSEGLKQGTGATSIPVSILTRQLCN